MQTVISLLNMFAGPISGLVEKGLLAGVVWFLTRTGLGVDNAPQIAAELYALFSVIFTAITKTQTAKIQSVNGAQNGVLVVPTQQANNAGIARVNAPLPG
jgi:hypothetical protein